MKFCRFSKYRKEKTANCDQNNVVKINTNMYVIKWQWGINLPIQRNRLRLEGKPNKTTCRHLMFIKVHLNYNNLNK